MSWTCGRTTHDCRVSLAVARGGHTATKAGLWTSRPPGLGVPASLALTGLVLQEQRVPKYGRDIVVSEVELDEHRRRWMAHRAGWLVSRGVTTLI